MSKHKVIMFDAMETIIDMYKIPEERDYARWAYEGSGVEHYWQDLSEFFEGFKEMRKKLREREPLYKEYDIQTRYKLIIEKKIGKGRDKESELLISKLLSNYWTKYKNKCYVSQEVRQTLDALSSKYRLGIVSNFLVRGGIEELLNNTGISTYFDFVVTSVNEGWRKPHPNIYLSALDKARAYPEKVIFVGDDYINDFTAPQKLGLTAILYDRKQAYPQINLRFSCFKDLLATISLL